MEPRSPDRPPTEPCEIYPDPSWFLIRSTRESFPRKGDFARLLLSGLHRCQSTGSEPAQKIYLYAPDFPHEQFLSSHFPGTVFMALPGPHPDLFSLISSENSEGVMVSVHTNTEPVISDALEELAMVYGGLQPQNRTTLVQELWTRGAREPLDNLAGPYTRDTIILPEKMGKMRLWSMASGYRDRITRKYKHYRYDAVPLTEHAANKPATQAIPVESGSGLACCLFSRRDNSLQRDLGKKIWTHTIKLAGKGVSLRAPELFFSCLTNWLQSLEGNSAKALPEKIYMVNPSWMLSFVFREQIRSEWPEDQPPAFLYPDLMLGWSPELSLLQFLSDGSERLLLTDFSSYPDVQCFYSEKGSDFEH